MKRSSIPAPFAVALVAGLAAVVLGSACGTGGISASTLALGGASASATGGGTGGATASNGGTGGAGACGVLTCLAGTDCCTKSNPPYCYPSACSSCCQSFASSSGLPAAVASSSGLPAAVASSSGLLTTGASSSGGETCGALTCVSGQACCKLGATPYCYPSACLACCMP
jgi:hypothetical protein